MENWYVMIHKRNAFQWVTEKIASIGIEFFSPTHTELRTRPDRPSPRKLEKQLFNGYLFLRFDPNKIHTTTIATIPGIQGFVRCGGQPSIVRNELIEGFRKALLLRPDRTLSHIEYRNLPSDLMRAIHLIVEMRSEIRRKAAFYALLEQEAISGRLTRQPGALICSMLHAPMSLTERAAPIVAEVIRRVGRSDMWVLHKALAKAYPFDDAENAPYKAWLSEVRRQLKMPEWPLPVDIEMLKVIGRERAKMIDRKRA